MNDEKTCFEESEPQTDEEKTTPSFRGEDTREEDIHSLINWALSSQLTWATIFLTCFIGLFQVYPNIEGNINIYYERLLIISLISIYIILVIGIFYSVYRIFWITHYYRSLGALLNDFSREKFFYGASFYQRLVSKDATVTKPNYLIIYTLSIGFALICLLPLIFKILILWELTLF